MQTRFCRLQYDGRYIWTDFGGELEDIDDVVEATRNFYNQHLKEPSHG